MWLAPRLTCAAASGRTMTYEPLFTYDTTWGGFLVDIFDTLALHMGFTFTIIAALPYEADPDTGHAMLAGGMADLVISDLSPAIVHQDTRVLKTTPFHNSCESPAARNAALKGAGLG